MTLMTEDITPRPNRKMLFQSLKADFDAAIEQRNTHLLEANFKIARHFHQMGVFGQLDEQQQSLLDSAETLVRQQSHSGRFHGEAIAFLTCEAIKNQIKWWY